MGGHMYFHLAVLMLFCDRLLRNYNLEVKIKYLSRMK